MSRHQVNTSVTAWLLDIIRLNDGKATTNDGGRP